jgi:tetratricopeptide (TPR) repeat protein
MERLADAIFYGKEAYEESYKITANAVEQFTFALGPRHPAILNLQHRLAWSLSEMGKLSESERVFRALISLQGTEGSRFIRSSEWKWPFGLGYVLKRTGNVVEATSWLERAFFARHVAYGALKTVTSGLCWELGDCYESQWRFDDALKLYCQLMYNVIQSGEGSMETMERLKWKISCIEEKIQQSASCLPPSRKNAVRSLGDG